MRSIILSILISSLAYAGPSSNRYVPGQFLKNGSGIFAIPSVSTNDQLVGRNTTDILTNKSVDAATNTIVGITNTSIASNAAIDFAKLAALPSANIVVGSSGNVPTSVAVTGDVTISNTGVTSYNNVVPLAKGGTNNASLANTSGGVVYMDGTRAQNTGAGATGTVLFGGTTPAFATLAVPTVQKFTSNSGTQTGSWFYFTGTGTFAIGDTYFDGSSHFFTALTNCSGCVDGWFSGASAYTSGNLTRSLGSGSTSMTVAGFGPMQAYTPTAGTKLVKITVIGGGGSGGGCATTSTSQCTVSSGGGGGGAAVKWVSNPSGTIYYGVGIGASAPSAGNNAGTRGGESVVVSSTISPIVGEGGYGGLTSGAAAAAPVIATPNQSAALGFGGDINSNGQGGGYGICVNAGSAGVVAGGFGGMSGLGGAGGTPNTFASFQPGSLGGGGAGCALSQSISAVAAGKGGDGGAIFEEFTQ